MSLPPSSPVVTYADPAPTDEVSFAVVCQPSHSTNQGLQERIGIGPQRDYYSRPSCSGAAFSHAVGEVGPKGHRAH